MKKMLAILMGTCLTVGALTGCSGSGSSAPETTAPAAEQSGSGTAEAAEGGGEAKTEAAAQSGEKIVVANLPKSVGGAWFNRMAVGIEKYGQDTGNEAFQTGADKGDAALQVKEVENLITQGVDVLTIVPVSPEALEPVLKKAREQGIIVISHEAQGIVNVDYDVEAFDGPAYGAHLMDKMAEAMGEEGEMCIRDR